MAATAPPPVSMDQLKQNIKAMWMAGDFGVVAKTISGGADEFVNRLAIPAGSRVLDVACGTGNTAIPLAKSGCIVTGVDIATNLLEQARARAAAEHVQAQFEEGDAEQLPYADASFDAVTTMFGAMFAPRPEMVAAEFARVLKAGGLLAMGNWNPSSFTGAMFRMGSKHVPPPPGVPAPVLWGDADTVRQRLGGSFTAITTELVSVDFDLPTNPAGAVDFFRTFFGPTKTQFARLDPASQAAYASDMEALWAENNVASDPEKRTLVRNQYLLVTARRK